MSSSRSGAESGNGGADLLRSASKTAEDGDPQIRSILTQLLSAAKQPPRTRIRLKIEDIYYLLDHSALVEIEVHVVCFCLFLDSFPQDATGCQANNICLITHLTDPLSAEACRG